MEMPIGKDDVLAALSDPKLLAFKFSIGRTTVGPEGFREVHGAIANGRIKVTPGADQRIAFYNMNANAIETPRRDPPLDVGDRAQLVHECVHAMNDLRFVNEVTLIEEAAGYLAQLTFMTLSMPPRANPQPSHLHPRLGPLMRLMLACDDVIAQYRLAEAAGFGAQISERDAFFLAVKVRGVPDYARLGLYEKGNPWLGVPGGGIEDLGWALRAARRPAASQGSMRF
jgi:hypothetical protein